MSSRFFINMIRANAMRTNALHTGAPTVSFNNAPLISPKPINSSWVTNWEGTNCHANKLANIVERADFKDPTPLPDVAEWDGTHLFEPEQFIRRHEILDYVEQFDSKAENMLVQMLSDDCHPPRAMYVYRGESELFLRFIPCNNSGLCDWYRNDEAVLGQPASSEPEDRLGYWLDSVFSGSGPDPVPAAECIYVPTKKMTRMLRRGRFDKGKEGVPQFYGPLPAIWHKSSRNSTKNPSQSDIALRMAAEMEVIEDDEIVSSGSDHAEIEQTELSSVMPLLSESSSKSAIGSEDVSSLGLEDILVWSRSEEEDRLERGRLAIEQLDRTHEEQISNSKDVEEGLPAPFPAHTPALPVPRIIESSSPWSENIFSPKDVSDSFSECSFASTISSNMEILVSWEDDEQFHRPIPVQLVKRFGA